jgi:hypothetical protein
VRPLQEAEASLGLTVPPARSRSALVVFHHLDGLLRMQGRGLVASRCQPWGSTRFTRTTARRSRETIVPLSALPESQAHTLRRVPLCCSRAASLRPLHLLPLAARRIAVKLRTAEADPHVTRARGPVPIRPLGETLDALAPRGLHRAPHRACSFHSSQGTRCREPWSGGRRRAPDFRALLRNRVRCRPPTVSDDQSLVPSMGLCPLRGPPRSAPDRSRGDGLVTAETAPNPTDRVVAASCHARVAGIPPAVSRSRTEQPKLQDTDRAAAGVCPNRVVRAVHTPGRVDASLHGVLGVKDHSEE